MQALLGRLGVAESILLVSDVPVLAVSEGLVFTLSAKSANADVGSKSSILASSLESTEADEAEEEDPDEDLDLW